MQEMCVLNIYAKYGIYWNRKVVASTYQRPRESIILIASSATGNDTSFGQFRQTWGLGY